MMLVVVVALLFASRATTSTLPHGSDPVAHQDIHTRILVSPPIINPTQDTIWVVGSTYSVTWNTSAAAVGGAPPSEWTNPFGQVVLGKEDGDNVELYIDNPLATEFPLVDGRTSIKVPAIPDGMYIIVLFGSSGNMSPQFRIINSVAPATTLSFSGTPFTLTGARSHSVTTTLQLPFTLSGRPDAGIPTSSSSTPPMSQTSQNDGSPHPEASKLWLLVFLTASVVALLV